MNKYKTLYIYPNSTGVNIKKYKHIAVAQIKTFAYYKFILRSFK